MEVSPRDGDIQAPLVLSGDKRQYSHRDLTVTFVQLWFHWL